MFTRRLKAPTRSFFIFGPRGTGKSTWLLQKFSNARRYDLLKSSEILRLSQDPDLLRKEVLALSKGSWVIMDEIQRIPCLLNEVQALMTEYKDQAQYALSGSSARKLKREGVNLLAGRAIQRHFFPINVHEMNYDYELGEILKFGCLPEILTAMPQDRVDLLNAYVDTYLAEEIRQEAIVRNLVVFNRFLNASALVNAQVLSMSNIARDCGVSRSTVQGYFQVLIDTLIGFFLPAWQPKAKVKEVAHPKYYYFDVGVVRALGGKLRSPVEEFEKGMLFETWILHELRAFMSDLNTGGTLSYWRTPSGSEVDFICSHGNRHVGIEVKYTSRWKSEYSRPLQGLVTNKNLFSAYGIYTGEQELKDGSVRIFPHKKFLKLLNEGAILIS